jgi:hypothetical protein
MSNGDQLPPEGPGFFTSAENDAKATEKLKLAATAEAGGWANFWQNLWAGFAGSVAFVIESLTRLRSKVLALIARFFLSAQGEQQPEFFDLLASIIEDYTGVEVDADKLKKDYFERGRIPGMGTVGGQVFNLLAQEFLLPAGQASPGLISPQASGGIGGLPTAGISPEQGVEAARRLLGFGMSFAVREGNVGAFSSILPFGIGSGFRDYGESLAANLNIGRNVGRAWRPLVQVLIADPLTQALNKQYHPHLLSEGQVATLFHANLVDQASLLEELDRQGYDPKKTAALLEIIKTHLTATDLELLERFGVISHGDAVHKLTVQGFTADDAELQLKVIDLKRLDVLVRAQADQAQKLFVDGVYNSDQLRASLDALPITDDEKKLRQVLAATTVENPTKFLTLAEMQSALTQGVIDVSELDDFLVRERYSQDDQTILRLLSLLKTAKAEEALAAAKARADAKAAKAAAKKPKPPGKP